MPDLTLMCNLRMCSIKEEVLKGKKDASKEKSMDVSFVQIELYNNSLAGHLTVKPSNLTALHQIYAPMNHFSFSIPNDILTIPNHENLRPYQNQLTDSITRTAASESKLLELHSLVSYILGSFPARLGAHFHLMSVKLFKKHLFVDIPRGIDVCCLLQELLLVEKDFTITLPSGLSIAEITTNDMEACGKATGSGNVFTIGVKIPGLKLIAKDDPSLCSQAVRCYVTKGFYTKFVINRDKVNITHGDRVKSLLKFNEPRVVAALEYDNGIFAPGRCTSCTVGGNSTTEPYIIAHNLILLHTTAEKV
ncbi:receptor-like protein kinase HSL1 [Dendrobium catenatum]|uniref:Beta-glucosidase 26 n=1 Tax=Dendrobium catenatum TaxID=906689 RepID=A0A2I0VLW8_9ASPA|nr:receptor-like protein kinase HSL1 [Dendrobium catenatum]PKU64404.1 Beta-glucosidase 26 [Dendrobium catenatum]